jgi:hypothetical protein
MDSNFEWQKHQANERVQKRLHEANVYRQARIGVQREPRFPRIISAVRSAFQNVFVLRFASYVARFSSTSNSRN